MDAPSAEELKGDVVVQAAFKAAWADSFPDDPALRHEEGGFLYAKPTTGEIIVRRALPGRRRHLDLTHAPVISDAFLVATYHTHPNPVSLGWNPEPSDEDRELAEGSGVPWFVISELGVYFAGPNRRVAGLSGNPGYPI